MPASLCSRAVIPRPFLGLLSCGAEAAFGYDVPNVLAITPWRNPHIHPGFWRGVNINQNADLSRELHGELAKEAGVDPLEFRAS